MRTECFTCDAEITGDGMIRLDLSPTVQNLQEFHAEIKNRGWRRVTLADWMCPECVEVSNQVNKRAVPRK